MGYAIQAYAVDEFRMKEYWGSHNEALVAQALATSLGQFHVGQMPQIKEALEEMSRGFSIGHQPEGARYLYAAEVLCSLYGAKVGEEIRLSPSGIENAPELRLFLASSPLFPQARVEDFPIVCAWGKKQVERRLASTQKWPAALNTEREIYNAWLRSAAEQKRGLVGFYY